MESVPGTNTELQRITIHGHERAYVKTGEGPALPVLIRVRESWARAGL